MQGPRAAVASLLRPPFSMLMSPRSPKASLGCFSKKSVSAENFPIIFVADFDKRERKKVIGDRKLLPIFLIREEKKVFLKSVGFLWHRLRRQPSPPKLGFLDFTFFSLKMAALSDFWKKRFRPDLLQITIEKHGRKMIKKRAVSYVRLLFNCHASVLLIFSTAVRLCCSASHELPFTCTDFLRMTN